jgi:hypothetical protein
MGRQSDEKLGHEAERERNHHEHAETFKNLQGLGRLDFLRIVAIHTFQGRILAPFRTHSNR